MPPGIPIGYLQQILARQAQAPNPTGPTTPGVQESEADRLYRMLLSQAPAYREPTTHERIAAGLMVPNTPIIHKDVGARSFLRGLVGGYKGSQGFGIPGQGALSRAALTGQLRGGGYGGITPAQLLNLQFRERADRRAEASQDRLNRSLESLMGQRSLQAENMKTDNERQAEQFQFQRGNEDFDRKMALRSADQRDRDYALDLQREARIAQADRIASGGLNPKWPELWKREYASTVDGLKQKLAYDKAYTVDHYLRDLQTLVDRFSERQFRLEGGQSGGSTTATRR